MKIGLEATGHYSNNITEFLVNKNLPIFHYQSVTYQSLQKKSKL